MVLIWDFWYWSIQKYDYLASVYGLGNYTSVYSTVADKINLNVGLTTIFGSKASLAINRPWPGTICDQHPRIYLKTTMATELSNYDF